MRTGACYVQADVLVRWVQVLKIVDFARLCVHGRLCTNAYFYATWILVRTCEEARLVTARLVVVCPWCMVCRARWTPTLSSEGSMGVCGQQIDGVRGLLLEISSVSQVTCLRFCNLHDCHGQSCQHHPLVLFASIYCAERINEQLVAAVRNTCARHSVPLLLSPVCGFLLSWGWEQASSTPRICARVCQGAGAKVQATVVHLVLAVDWEVRNAYLAGQLLRWLCASRVSFQLIC